MKTTFLKGEPPKRKEGEGNRIIEAARMAGAGVVPAFWEEVESELARIEDAAAPKVEARLTRSA